jgi:Alw26I/Eco31I/Esp3I family type II restriction m6 adenine DNA methyltransferase
MSLRKDFGVVYTPTEITQFLCKTTIFLYLLDQLNGHFETDYSLRSCNKIEAFLLEIPRNQLIYIYEIIRKIRILDPAVGIGFFLLESLNILEEIYLTFVNADIVKVDSNSIRKRIVRRNLFGIDISEEAIETCKQNLGNLLKDNEKEISESSTILDCNLKTGNALLGRIFERDEEELIPLNPADNAFNWYQEFPNVMKEGGFDLILGNPPWNILKPQEKEFFSKFDSRLTKYNVDKREATEIINKLLENETVKSQWKKYKDTIRNQAQFFRKEYKFQSEFLEVYGKSKKVSGDLNLYKLFIERIYHLLKPNGYCSIVVPSGIHTDAGTKGLRKLLFESNEVHYLYCFENRKGIFPSIHKSFKFDLLGFKKGGKTRTFNVLFMHQDIDILNRIHKYAIKINWELIKRLSWSSWSILEFKTELDIKIAKKMYRHPRISEKRVNKKWNLNLTRELDITLDSILFNTDKQGYPIYEGKMIEQYTHLFKEPRYWIENKKLFSKFDSKYQDYQEFRLGFRSVAASTNRRTMVATVIPNKVCVGNSIIISRIFDSENSKRLIDENDLLYLCGIFNSFVFDYLLRLKVTTNINMFYIYDMPVPTVSTENKEYENIVKHVALLLSSYPRFESLAKYHELTKMTEDRLNRQKIWAIIDVLVAKLYGINHKELEYILDQFHQKDSKKEALLSLLKNEIHIQFKAYTDL